MQLDTTLNLPTLVTLAVAIIGLVVWLVRLEARTNENGKDIEDLNKSFGALRGLVELHKEQFHAYQLEVAREYTTHTIIGEIKRDLITEIGRMEARVEVQINRLVEARQ